MEDKSIYNKKKTGRKTRQKGFGWYGSLNPNAGDVEKNIEIFNAAQPDGGIGAVSPVNGNAMGEDIEQEKPKRYPLYMWKALEDTVAGMSNIPDGYKEKFISLVGDRATVKRIPGVGHKSALLPTSLRNKYGYTNANYNTLITRPETFNLTLEQGLTDIYDVMKSKWFKNDLSESTSDKIDWEGLKKHLKGYLKDEHLKWNISDIGEEAPNYGVGEDNYPEFFKILDSNNFGGTDKINKLIDYIDNQIKNVNESFEYQMDNGMIEDSFYTFERDHLTYHFFHNPRRSERGKYAILVIDYGWRFDKEPYTNERGTTTIPVSRVHDKPQQIAYFEFTEESHPEIVDAMYEDDRKNYRDLIVAEAKKHMNEDLNEATASTRYSYTGPIYHLGNKIAEKSKLYTMAKSWKQAKNNFLYKIANGDIVGHYDLVDEFVKEVPKATLDTPAIEEKPEIVKCEICGTQLNPMGECPVCDYGEDDLLESIHIDSNLDALSQLNRMDEIV